HHQLTGFAAQRLEARRGVQPVLLGACQGLGEARLRAAELGDARCVRTLVERRIGQRPAGFPALSRQLREAPLDGGELPLQRFEPLPEAGARSGGRAPLVLAGGARTALPPAAL